MQLDDIHGEETTASPAPQGRPVMPGQLVGRGVIYWPGYQRSSDRYGSVCLVREMWLEDEKEEARMSEDAYVVFDPALEGRRGTLWALVVEPRDSSHIGDLFRGLHAATPRLWSVMRLGWGTIFLQDHNIGVVLCTLLRANPERRPAWRAGVETRRAPYSRFVNKAG